MRNRKATYLADPAFNALADPTRRAVLDLLRQGSLPAGRSPSPFPSLARLFRSTCAYCAAHTSFKSTVRAGSVYTG